MKDRSVECQPTTNDPSKFRHLATKTRRSVEDPWISHYEYESYKSYIYTSFL